MAKARVRREGPRRVKARRSGAVVNGLTAQFSRIDVPEGVVISKVPLVQKRLTELRIQSRKATLRIQRRDEAARSRED